MTSVSTGGGGSVLIQEIQAKYVPTTLIAAEAICCKYLLIILEASYQPKNRSRRRLWDFRIVQASLEERTQLVNCPKLHI
jgi:hypothetical protein